MRRRNILWDEKTNALAERLAVERGYTHAKGGVSQFLEDLVLAEAAGKTAGGFEKALAQIRTEVAELKKTSANHHRKKETHD